MFPIKIIEEFANTLNFRSSSLRKYLCGGNFLGLTCRRFGNWMLAEQLPQSLPTLAWQGFSVFVGAIQAFIFTMLTMVYLSHKVSQDH